MLRTSCPDRRDLFRCSGPGAQRISRLIDGLLEFSRIGELEDAPPKKVEAEAALHDAIHNLRIAINEQQGEVTHDPLPEVVRSMALVFAAASAAVGCRLMFLLSALRS